MNNEKSETPLMDLAPKMIATVIKCQNILAEYIVPDSGISDHDVISSLLGVLDSKSLVIAMRNAIGNTYNPVIKESKPVKCESYREMLTAHIAQGIASTFDYNKPFAFADQLPNYIAEQTKLIVDAILKHNQ